MCLWDFVSCVDKTPIKSRRDAGSVSDQQPDYNPGVDNYTLELDDDADDFDIPTNKQSDFNKRRRRLQVSYKSEHPEHVSRIASVRLPGTYYVPIPCGPSIPRRDRSETQSRHARLMLILFKPWRFSMNVRTAGMIISHECSSRESAIAPEQEPP
ncbi:hypothetical protein BDQ17DRAFT_1298501 [Cyathus striatus]|nr:hypothetical protein BDQ17DRAFT_1298501 [Cyathus striatus]